MGAGPHPRPKPPGAPCRGLPPAPLFRCQRAAGGGWGRGDAGSWQPPPAGGGRATLPKCRPPLPIPPPRGCQGGGARHPLRSLSPHGERGGCAWWAADNTPSPPTGPRRPCASPPLAAPPPRRGLPRGGEGGTPHRPQLLQGVRERLGDGGWRQYKLIAGGRPPLLAHPRHPPLHPGSPPTRVGRGMDGAGHHPAPAS